MKHFILILFAIIISLQIEAQATNSTRSDFCSPLQQFAGEWKWTHGNQTISIFLKFHRQSTTLGTVIVTRDCLIGWHEYTVDGLVIESDYQFRFSTLPTNFDNFINYSIFLTFDKLLNPCDNLSRHLAGSIRDYVQMNEGMDVAATVDGISMSWGQKPMEWHGSRTGAYGMTLPSHFILTKQ